MIAKLIHKNGKYICSECRMNQIRDLMPFCDFCGANFSNYEQIMILKFKEEVREELQVNDD